ncbi:MAG TPA: diacylglycerol kinase family protein [Pyrinomonadaceae bacterium]|nr:diacylglycerol kinase family protein [Pyrinomonadaceae bacterium]
MPRATTTKVIVNAASGPGDQEELSERLSEVFNANGLSVDVSLARSGAEVSELARAAARDHWNTIVAGGGDGTINTVASAVVETDKVLGILPLGTLNHFARDLKLPKDLTEAARTIASGRVVTVDVGEVNGRTFLNNSSLGLYPIIVRERQKQQRLGSGKWPAFVWAALATMRRYPFIDIRLSVEGKEFHRRTPFVIVGNNEYAMDAFSVGMRERLDRGQLSVYTTQRTGRWGLVRLALRALFGRLREDKDFLELSTTEVKIETRRKRVRVAFDGEVDVMEGPLQYRIRPGALRVIVPAEEEK